MTRDCIIAGNWKMYKTTSEAVEFVKTLAPLIEGSQAEVFLAVPFTNIQPAVYASEGSRIVIGAQNMNDSEEGAFTGEIAARMLCDVGAEFVILGHSERRHTFHESNLFINKKVKRALASQLRPILCVGETYEEREAGRTEEVLEEQLRESLRDITDLQNLIVAYEPVWAIGTGHTATPDIAQERHAHLRAWIAQNWSKSAAEKLVIQYGGSVKPENAKELLGQQDIDGALVGGASLVAESFSQIVKAKE